MPYQNHDRSANHVVPFSPRDERGELPELLCDAQPIPVDVDPCDDVTERPTFAAAGVLADRIFTLTWMGGTWMRASVAASRDFCFFFVVVITPPPSRLPPPRPAPPAAPPR